MSSPNNIAFAVVDADNVPLTGLELTFATYMDFHGANLTQPAITEIGGGFYQFLPDFYTRLGICYTIATGNTPSLVTGYVRPEDYSLPIQTAHAIVFLLLELDGYTPATGLTLAFETYEDNDGNAVSNPDINEIGNGYYYFTPLFPSQDVGLAYLVDTTQTSAPWSIQDAGTSADLNDVHGRDASHIWAVGTGTTIRFYNGLNWYDQSPYSTFPLYSVFTFENKAWAVGANDTFLKTTDSSNWLDQTPPVSGKNWKAIWGYGSDTLNLLAGTDDGYLYASADSGATWSLDTFLDGEIERIRGTSSEIFVSVASGAGTGLWRNSGGGWVQKSSTASFGACRTSLGKWSANAYPTGIEQFTNTMLANADGIIPGNTDILKDVNCNSTTVYAAGADTDVNFQVLAISNFQFPPGASTWVAEDVPVLSGQAQGLWVDASGYAVVVGTSGGILARAVDVTTTPYVPAIVYGYTRPEDFATIAGTTLGPTPQVIPQITQTVDLGQDTYDLNDLPVIDTQVYGLQNLALRLARRFTTPYGALAAFNDDPDFGYDIYQLVNAKFDRNDIVTARADMENEALKEEEVQFADISIVPTDQESYEITMDIQSSLGPFQLVLNIGNVTYDTLKINQF